MSPVLTFGKHKGKRLEDVDASYLTWVLENVAMLNSGLRLDIKAELKRRQAQASGHYTYSASAAPRRLPSGVSIDQVLELIDAGRRSLARKHHPDAGGNTQAMQAINQAADFLSETLPAILEAQRR